ncbi:MAG: cbb3-type cytochrome c oxidase subunit I [Solirubrobacterales bacterium]
MSTGNGSISPHPELAADGIPALRPRWVELATSGNHKDVGRMLITGGLSFLALAAIELVLLRLQLAIPENDLIDPTAFNRLLSVSGVTVVFLAVLPLAFGLFAYLVPLQIGARGLAFGRLSNFSFWLWVLGVTTIYTTFVFTPPDTGLNPWPPLSESTFASNNGVDGWIVGCGLALLGMVLMAANIVATLRTSRAPGMAWRRVPLFSWAAAVCSYVVLVAGGAMLAAMTMLFIDRHFSGVFFDAGESGAPLYWQHLSSIFFNAVWIVTLLPAIGAISEILSALSGKPLFGRRPIAAAMVAIGVLGLLAWIQNMFTAAIPLGFLYAAQFAAVMLIVPFGMILFNWFGTLAGGALQRRAPLLFALGAISTITVGLAMNLVQAVIPADWMIAGTAADTATSGYVIVGGAVLGNFAALHYWYPKITGRTMGETMARISLVAILVGVHLTFLPMFVAGLDSQPADVYKYFDVGSLDVLNLISTIGAVVLAIGVLATVINALLSRESGARAGHDPWRGETLEWYALAPPPEHNFDVVPDIRSAQPLRDIRDAVTRSTT